MARGVEEHAPNHSHAAYWRDSDMQECPFNVGYRG
jgi:hypothetical protein